MMRRLVKQYKVRPEIRETALNLIQFLPQKDWHGELNAVYQFVKNRIRYVRDIRGVETVQTPLKTLEYGQGDCDDKVTLLAALLSAIGFKTRFKAIGFKPDQYVHVFLEVFINGKWLPMETTENVSIGWRPPYYRAAMVVDNDS